MNTGVHPPAVPTIPGEPGWTLAHHASVTTTQTLARDLPAWSAVWADAQTAGRGQAERTFVSDPGGLYLTAVLPYDGDALRSRGFALAVGRAVWEVLRQAGVNPIRLRWPNDLMSGSAKVGGILVEQGGPQTLLVGLGLNIANRPWLDDPTLVGIAGRLADSCGESQLPAPAALVQRLLRAIQAAYHEFGHLRLAGLAELLVSCWGEPREVALEPAHGVTLTTNQGRFLGIDAEGAVRMQTPDRVEITVPAHHIQRLREVVAASG